MKLAAIFVLFSMFCSVFASRGEERFLSRDFIDTTVQGAFNAFVMASRESSAGGVSQTRAIERARGVVNELRSLAENDPNRRYILFRLSELEAQISLEEEEVRFRERYARVQQINELVDIFNKEFMQARPNFANLQQLYNRMVALDTRTSNQFADLLNQKMRSVSINLANDVNAAFNANNYTQVENLFNYAVENRRFLRVSDSDLERWRRRIQSKKDADYLIANIDARITFVNGVVNQNRLLEARRHIEVLNSDLTGASGLLPRPFVNTTRTRLNGLLANVNRREDSLVQRGHALIEAKRFDEAAAYLNNVLFPAGVDRNRIAGIDRAIIAATGSGASLAEYQSGITAFGTISQESGSAMSDAMNQRMRQRADSIRHAARVEEEESRRHFEARNRAAIRQHNANLQNQIRLRDRSDNFLYSVQKLFDRGRDDAAVKRFRSGQAQALSYATPRLFYDVKHRVNNHIGVNSQNDPEIIAVMRRHAETRPEAKRTRAEDLTREIYDLLERRQTAQAYGVYYFNRDLLTEFAFPDALTTMRRTLIRAYARDMR